MEIETEANPAAEGMVTLADARETIEAQQGAETEASSTDDLDSLAQEALGESPANPEFIEVEIDGKKLKITTADGTPVDPELQFGALRDADYRKKTMTLSEERKSFQQEREQFQARANLQGDAALRATQLTTLDAQIRQAAQIPVAELRQAGWTEEQIQEAATELQGLQRQRGELARQVNADLTNLQQTEQAEFRAAREEAVKQAGLNDKALTPDRIEYLEKWAMDKGVSEQDARTITDPTVYNILHLADVGQKFIERQRNAANIRAAAAGGPVTTVGGVNAGGKSPEDMSFEEYAAWREAGNG